MEQFRKFLRDKAFALVLTACLLAAAAAGVWAVRTVRNELKQDLDAVRSPSSTAPGIDEGINTSPGVAGEEEAEWQQQNAPAANSVANVPKADSSSGGAASSSGAQSGSGSVREPSALQTESLPASSSAAPASTQPVSGRVLNSYSGDELVYSKTLGDWRTHNGVDYAASRGAEVTAPAAGKKNKLPAAALLQRAGGKLAEIDHILAGFFAGGGGDDKGLGQVVGHIDDPAGLFRLVERFAGVAAYGGIIQIENADDVPFPHDRFLSQMQIHSLTAPFVFWRVHRADKAAPPSCGMPPRPLMCGPHSYRSR